MISYLEQEGRDQIITGLTPLLVTEKPQGVFQTLKYYQPGRFNQVELVSGNLPAILVSSGSSYADRLSDTGDFYHREYIVTVIIELINDYQDILEYCDLVFNALSDKRYLRRWDGAADLVDPDMSFIYRNLLVTIPGKQAI